ncbi:hypothetical protein C5167_027589 [Papaver somniferum]|nr:hypothetical protein C5167_027589 [Papaver somniferum]
MIPPIHHHSPPAILVLVRQDRHGSRNKKSTCYFIFILQLLQDNGFDKVKLFEPDPHALAALATSGIQVMLGIPNEFLAALASSVRVAENWVQQNVSTYIRDGVDIRSVAVGNEPFLKTYGQAYLQTTFPALKNIQAALIKAGLGKQIKVTVYQTSRHRFPHGLHRQIPKREHLYADSHFPVDYAFFSGTATPVVDGPISYSNVFEANYDTLIWDLEKNGFPSVPHLNVCVSMNKSGTPKRKSAPETYVFGLIDEDAKSIDPGNFDRHWGMFNRKLVPAKGVKYLEKQWCVMSPQACTHADCTSLGDGSSCSDLDASYAFTRLRINRKGDPKCKFDIMIDVSKQAKLSPPNLRLVLYSNIPCRLVGMGTNMYPSSALLDRNRDDHEALPVDELVEQADGFAGVFPEHKYEIVKMLQEKKHICGMTGDGVNDAPALKKADIGIAVSDSTDAARSAADIVLTEPGLSVIIHAVLTSRSIFQRMKNYTIYAVSITIRIVLGFVLLTLIWKYDFPPFMVLVIAILNDGTIMTISKDRVKPSPKPDNWKLNEIFATGIVIGTYLALVTVLFYWTVTATTFFQIEKQNTTGWRSSILAEKARRRTEIARMGELHSISAHTESALRLKNLDLSILQSAHTL